MVDGLGGWWLVAWCKPTCGHHATTTHWRCACCLTLSSCPFSLPFCPFLFLFLFLLLLLWMKSAKLGAMPSTHHQVLCALCLVCGGGFVCVVCGGVGWHATLVWVAPVVVVGVFGHWCHPPRLWCQWCQSLWCWCPCPHPFSHSHSLTQAWHTTTPHTHTRLVAGPLWSLVCVCVWARCWLSPRLARHSHHHPLLLPHSTPPVLLLLLLVVVDVDACGGSVGVVACVATWSTHWLCWCCPLPHPHTHTHTHGVVGTWWWWLCVWCGCHHHCAPFPPTTTTVSAAPPCPLCVRVCVRVSGGTRHSGALWWHARWCVAERAPCPPHPPPTLSTLVRSLSSRSPSLTSHTHTQMARLTPHTHMAWFVWLHPCTTASEHTPWCTALALTTTCVLLVCVLWCAPQLLLFPHTHRGGNGLWCRVAQKSALRERERMNTHTRPLPFLSFSLTTLFNGASGGTHCPSPPLSNSLVHSLSSPCACK